MASAADVSEVIEGGHGPFVASAQPPQVPDAWIEDERVVAGTATSYCAVGELAVDGRFVLAEDQTADYRTRIVVRRPEDPGAFSGTVVVEWMNVTGGLDAAPGHTVLAAELNRRGHAWVGVSAQHIGVEGGPVMVSSPRGAGIAGLGLRALVPARYDSLHHPGDAFAYDIFTQVAGAVRSGAALGGLVPTRVLAEGQSQAAFALTTYVNGVHPLTGAFDGYFIHSRGRGFLPLGEPGTASDLMSAMTGPAATIRTDLDVPVLMLQTETDLTMLGFVHARQDDTDRIRTWEVAGTAHADLFTVGGATDVLGCDHAINDGPLRFVARAALSSLDRWVRDGAAPAIADRVTMAADGAIARDADGIALGGIRTAPVDVPVDVLSGDPPAGSSIICLLFGTTTPLAEARVAQAYGSVGEYVAAYEAATDGAVAAGFVLEDDRGELLAQAKPDRVAAAIA